MASSLAGFMARSPEVVLVRIERVRGSSPREAGTEMYVAADGMHGTIGGGQLEYMALDQARRLLAENRDAARMDVPLGPEIGQCCGGRVEVALARLCTAAREEAIRAEAQARAAWPQVCIFGAGHVGRAMAGFFALLPVRTMLIDTRAEELQLCAAPVDLRHTPLPEAEIRAAPPGSAYIVLTHDHALDFLLTAEALTRGDAAYVGMIGSATKREKFRRFCRDEGNGLRTDALICPIGAAGSDDKRPEVIAAFVVAEVMVALTGAWSCGAEARPNRQSEKTEKKTDRAAEG